MMKSIHDVSTEERLTRALLAIEGLTYFEEENDDNFTNKVYAIAHSALQMCGGTVCQELDVIEKAEADLKEANIMDAEKLLIEHHVLAHDENNDSLG